MNWLELWARWQVIGMIIGWILGILIILCTIVKQVIIYEHNKKNNIEKK